MWYDSRRYSVLRSAPAAPLVRPVKRELVAGASTYPDTEQLPANKVEAQVTILTVKIQVLVEVLYRFNPVTEKNKYVMALALKVILGAEPSIRDSCLAIWLLLSVTYERFILTEVSIKHPLQAVRPSPRPELHAAHTVAPPKVAS